MIYQLLIHCRLTLSVVNANMSGKQNLISCGCTTSDYAGYQGLNQD